MIGTRSKETLQYYLPMLLSMIIHTQKIINFTLKLLRSFSMSSTSFFTILEDSYRIPTATNTQCVAVRLLFSLYKPNV